MVHVVLFDLGTNKGQIIEAFVQVFGSGGIPYTVHAFEPYSAHFRDLGSKFRDNSNIHLYQNAIALANGPTKLHIEEKRFLGNSIYSSKYNVSQKNYETVQAIKFSEWLRTKGMSTPEDDVVYILKINIEGAEYDVFRDLAEHALIPCFRCLLVSDNGTSDMNKCMQLKDKVTNTQKIVDLFPKVYSYHGSKEKAVTVFETIFSSLLQVQSV